MSRSAAVERRVTLAINLQLRPAPDGASARIELHLDAEGSTAVVRVSGRLEAVALGRLAQSLGDLAGRGVKHLVLDGSALGDVPLETAGALIEALAPFAAASGDYAVCGLSPQLHRRLRGVAGEAAIAPTLASFSLVSSGSSREWAS